ncbi:MAG: hypothetical protein SFX73_18550 [Kofleriaceae bacterium]|nr:hypothetical protein [Kofleriaceae bacterium]
MRSMFWARWATCALAIMIIVPVAAAGDGGSKRSISSCTTFDQVDKDEETVELTIHNACTVPVDCSISWRVVCAPDSKKRRMVHPGSKKVSLETAGTTSAQASASVCGDDAFAIDSIQWSCEPSKE